MVSRAAIVGWLFACALTLAPPVVGASPEKRARSVLEDVKELEKPVTYTETKIPLGELVLKVAQDTGVPLTASKEVSDEPVAVVVRDFPARDLLEQLADLLDYRWSRRMADKRQGSKAGNDMGRPAPRSNLHPPSPIYAIYQDVAAKQREEALRRATQADVEKRLMDQLHRLMQMAALPPDEINRMVKDHDDYWRKWSLLSTDAERRALAKPLDARDWGNAVSLASPVIRSLVSLVGRLSPEQWATLYREGQISFSSEQEVGDLPLPTGVARAFRSAEFPPNREILPPPMNPPETFERAQQEQRDAQKQWAAAAGYRVTLQLRGNPSRFKKGGSLHLSVSATPIFNRIGMTSMEVVPHEGTSLSLSAGPVNPPSQAAQEDPQRLAALQKDPVVGAKKRFKPEGRPRLRPSWPGATLRRLSDLLPGLSRTYSVSFIADSYWTAPSIPTSQLPTAEPIALFALLDHLGGSSCEWHHRDHLIRLRSLTWPFDRAQEIPLRLVRRWQELEEQRGALPLEEYVGSMATLSDEQLQLADALFVEGAFPVYPAYDSRNVLRLYVLLAPWQRQGLWEGKPVPVAQMTTAQQALFVAALREHEADRPSALTPEALAAASLSLATEPQTLVRERLGAVISQRIEVTTPPTARPPMGTLASPPANTGLDRKPAARPHAVRRYPMTLLKFQLQFGSDVRESRWLRVASPP